MIQVMVDLETMGVGACPAIASIGAVKFDPSEGKGGRILDNGFYRLVDLKSCMDIGLEMESETVLWWLQQEEKARMALCETFNKGTITQVLKEFSQWYGQEKLPIWGDGAAQDNVWFKSAYKAAGVKCPWGYREDRCYRTVRQLRPMIVTDPVGTKHHALDDAIFQAKHLMKVLATLPHDHGLK